jgi:hypothetical protein
MSALGVSLERVSTSKTDHLAHKTKELDPRAALLAFAYEFRTVAKRLERDERKLMVQNIKTS